MGAFVSIPGSLLKGIGTPEWLMGACVSSCLELMLDLMIFVQVTKPMKPQAA